MPTNPIGWLLALSGLLFAVGECSAAVAGYGLAIHPGSVPGAEWFAWLSQWVDNPAFAIAVGFVPLLFPTGHLLSPRWRGVAVAAGTSVIVGSVANAFGSWSFGTTGTANPLAFSGTAGDVISLLATAASIAAVVFLVPIVASLVTRYRRAAGIEQAQLRWFAYVGVMSCLALVVGVALSGYSTGFLSVVAGFAWVTFLVGIALLPVAIGVAILRYRLYDIDLIIRRTVVYVPLTAVLAGVYAASVAFFQRLFITATGNPSDGAVILSTLILATTFTPIKSGLQATVDRHFRDAQDTERQLQTFVDRVTAAEWTPDPARTMRAFLSVCIAVTRAAGGAAYVGSAAEPRLVAGTPSPAGQPAVVVPVEVAVQRIGRMELEARPGKRPYGDREVEMLRRAGEHVAAAVIGLTDGLPVIAARPER